MRKKCLNCGKFLNYYNREIFNNLKDYSEGSHFEGWYICSSCGFKIKAEDYYTELNKIKKKKEV